MSLEAKFSAVNLLNPDAGSGLLIVCEHASNYVPERFNNLGLAPNVLETHIAWDLGAADLAKKIAHKLDAELIKAEVSRLVYDCNRPPEAVDAIVEKSEIYDVPGNKGLSDGEKALRVETVYTPFSDLLSKSAKRAQALITIHSFTPVYHGVKRKVEVGVLHDEDTRLADAFLKIVASAADLDVRRNEPYSAVDGVTHTLQRHGIANQIPNLMLEIRNDLLQTEAQLENLAATLCNALSGALEYLRSTERSGS